MILARPSPEKPLDFVACQIATVTYALEVDSVREIIQPAELTPLPHAPPSVIGTIEHRATIIPIVDLGRQLNLGPTTAPRRKWVLVRQKEQVLGLVVTKVLEVFQTQRDALRPAPQIGLQSSASTRYVVPFQNTIAYLLELDQLFEPPPALSPLGPLHLPKQSSSE